jgi:hypothetical protein
MLEAFPLIQFQQPLNLSMSSFRIFLSSPSDCTEERAVLHEIASRLNADSLVLSFTQIEVVAELLRRGLIRAE